MSGARKRGLDDDPSRAGEIAKIRKDGQGQEAPDVEQRLLDMNGPALRKLKGAIDERLTQVEPDARRVRKQTNRPGNVNRTLEKVDKPQPHEPRPLELHLSQAEHSAPHTSEGGQGLRLDNNSNHVLLDNVAQNDISGLLEPLQREQHPSQIISQPAANIEEQAQRLVTEEPRECWNHRMKLAYIKRNSELLMKLHQMKADRATEELLLINQLCSMIKQMTELSRNAQCGCIMIARQKFTQAILLKLRDFEREVPQNMYVIFQQLVEMLQTDALCPGIIRSPFNRCLLVHGFLESLMLNSGSAAAQHFLRALKLRLTSLYLYSKQNNAKIKLIAVVYDLDHRKFEYETVVNNVDAIHLFNFIMRFCDVSEAEISLKSGSVDFDLLRSEFGTPPKSDSQKIQVARMVISPNDAIPSLGVPEDLILYCGRDLKEFRKEPSLTSGVKVIELRKMLADPLMEILKAPVRIEDGAIWTHKNVIRVLTNHTLSGEDRRIEYMRPLSEPGTNFIKTVEEWEQFIDCLSRTFEADYKNIGCKATLTVSDNRDSFTLTLH